MSTISYQVLCCVVLEIKESVAIATDLHRKVLEPLVATIRRRECPPLGGNVNNITFGEKFNLENSVC